MTKCVLIGDVHGEDIIWDIEDLGYLALLDFRNKPKYDKYIFTGNYVDSDFLHISRVIDNLEKLIALKKRFPDNIVLLLGNIELSYLYGNEIFHSDSFRYQYRNRLNRIYKENLYLFYPLYAINNNLFSQAGISKSWLNLFNQEYCISEDYINVNLINEVFYQTLLTPSLINHNSLIFASKKENSFLHSSMFFADVEETSKDIVPHWHQWVGHTPVLKMQQVCIDQQYPDYGSITYLHNIPSTTDVDEIYKVINI